MYGIPGNSKLVVNIHWEIDEGEDEMSKSIKEYLGKTLTHASPLRYSEFRFNTSSKDLIYGIIKQSPAFLEHTDRIIIANFKFNAEMMHELVSQCENAMVIDFNNIVLRYQESQKKDEADNFDEEEVKEDPKIIRCMIYDLPVDAEVDIPDAKDYNTIRTEIEKQKDETRITEFSALICHLADWKVKKIIYKHSSNTIISTRISELLKLNNFEHSIKMTGDQPYSGFSTIELE